MEESQKLHPTLRVTAGPEEGKRIHLVGRYGPRAVDVGSQVDGSGRLTASGVAAHHAQVVCMPDEENEDQLQVGIAPEDGEVVVNGEPQPYGSDLLKPGDEVAFGDCTLVMEMVEELPPEVQAEVTAKQQAAAGGRPYRWFVQFKPKGGEKAVGVLAAGKGMLSLAGRDGRSVLQVPLEGLDVSFPRHRSSVIDITAQGIRYEVRLLEPAWLPDAEASWGDAASEVETDVLPPNFGASLIPVTDPSLGTELEGAAGLAWSALNQLGGRMERHTWKQIIQGERQPEEVSQEYAT